MTRIDWSSIMNELGYKNEKKMWTTLYQKFGGLQPLGDYLGVDYTTAKRRMVALGLRGIIKGRGGPNNKGKAVEGKSWDLAQQFGLKKISNMTHAEIQKEVGLTHNQIRYLRQAKRLQYKTKLNHTPHKLPNTRG